MRNMMIRAMAVAAVACGAPVAAQDPAPAATQDPAVVAAPAPPPAPVEEWKMFSTSARSAYLADVGRIAPVDGVPMIRLARVPLSGDAGDYSHEVDEVSVRCEDKHVRTGVTISYGPDSAETDRYTDDAAGWESVAATSVYGALQRMACDGARPSNDESWPNLQAFVDSGRGG